jgi:hypothetical protein
MLILLVGMDRNGLRGLVPGVAGLLVGKACPTRFIVGHIAIQVPDSPSLIN